MRGNVRTELTVIVEQLVGTQVEIRTFEGRHIAVPLDRALLGSPTWRELRAGPQAGIGSSPEEALLLLAHAAGSSSAGVRRVAAAREADRWLRTALEGAGGPVLVCEVQRAARAAGIASETLRRAATRIGVVRRKHGLHGGWSWSLPAVRGPVAESGTTPIEDGMTQIASNVGTAGGEQ
jgi:hypothetical protein